MMPPPLATTVPDPSNPGVLGKSSPAE